MVPFSIFKIMQLQSKRVMDAPSFGVHRVESSHQHLMAGPTLDPQRAESAHQHVRALNSQFARYVTNGVVKQMTPASFPSFHDSGSQSSGVFSCSQKPAFSGN
ncbi:hypothetical protein GW17_00056196 [Ensete ventricosum]|nr:hypothetical protein GW17_00056196 [Ensete ventricosum]